jgi:phosphomannomutase
MNDPILLELQALTGDLYAGGEARGRAAARRDALFADLKRTMRDASHPPKTAMKFGTSGWRGLLVEDFTVQNVACVTQALIDSLLDPRLHADLGVADGEDLRRRGCVIAHDTRIMGPEFADVAARILIFHGIKVIAIGMATTPEVSAAVVETGAAFSINFTPSHNPFQYHGYKFNPADGGPATKELTGPVAARAQELLTGSRKVSMVDDAAYEKAKRDGTAYVRADPIELYKRALGRRLPWFDLGRLIKRINDSDIAIFVDNGFGATRGKYERLLHGVTDGRLRVINGGEDYLFGGKSREPSVENFGEIQAAMRASKARLAVGVMNDGDGDRFVGGGREGVLVMNKYGPLVVRYLAGELGVRGDVARSVMTSHMAEAALGRYLPGGALHETRVGFQYLKGFIDGSVNSWEESDGMSPKGWSHDKDGLLAALLLVDMVLHHGTTPEALLAQTEAELGTFLFERRKVTGAKHGDALTAALSDRFGAVQPGQTLDVAGRPRRVADAVRVDGTKIVFDDGSWFGVRASGTEPLCRPYVEVPVPAGASSAAVEAGRSDHQAIMDWLCAEIRAATA